MPYNTHMATNNPFQIPNNQYDAIAFLCDVYSDYCNKHNLPKVSADEQDFGELTQRQVLWIEHFIDVWDAVQDWQTQNFHPKRFLIMINSEVFGMSFWINDEQDFMYCPTFINGQPDFDNTGYVEEWDDWSDMNVPELIRIMSQLYAR